MILLHKFLNPCRSFNKLRLSFIKLRHGFINLRHGLSFLNSVSPFIYKIYA